MVKSKLRKAMAWGYHLSGRYLSRWEGKVIILTYHRVLSKKELAKEFVQSGMYVRDDIFEKQMEFLREHFEILAFYELLDLWDRGLVDKRKRYCVITFDDGWLDNYIYAYPILKKYNIPATLFLPTAYIGASEWFWPDRIGYLLNRYLEPEQKGRLASLRDKYPWMGGVEGRGGEGIDSIIEICKRLPVGEVKKVIKEMSQGLEFQLPSERLVVNWSEVEEMSRSGISFGSHSVTHAILTKLSSEEVRSELEVSLRALDREKVNTVPVFCYPNGSLTQAIAEQVKQAGYRAAVGGRFGFESEKPENIFQLRRIGVHQDISATVPLFSWHLAGLNHLLA